MPLNLPSVVNLWRMFCDFCGRGSDDITVPWLDIYSSACRHETIYRLRNGLDLDNCKHILSNSLAVLQIISSLFTAFIEVLYWQSEMHCPQLLWEVILHFLVCFIKYSNYAISVLSNTEPIQSHIQDKQLQSLFRVIESIDYLLDEGLLHWRMCLIVYYKNRSFPKPSERTA